MGVYIYNLSVIFIHIPIYTNFCILIFYPETSPSSLGYSCFSHRFLRIFQVHDLSSLFFANFYDFTLFSCHITQVRTLSRICRTLKTIGERGYLCLILNLMRKAFNIFILKLYFLNDFIDVLHQFEKVPFYFYIFWELFSQMNIVFYQMLFKHQL